MGHAILIKDFKKAFLTIMWHQFFIYFSLYQCYVRYISQTRQSIRNQQVRPKPKFIFPCSYTNTIIIIYIIYKTYIINLVYVLYIIKYIKRMNIFNHIFMTRVLYMCIYTRPRGFSAIWELSKL